MGQKKAQKMAQRQPRRLRPWAFGYAAFALGAAVCVFPAVFMVSGSFMAPAEVLAHYGGIRASGAYAALRLLPDAATLSQYYGALVRTSFFLDSFWNSVRLTVPILAGVVAVGTLAGYAFAVYEFPFKRAFLLMYVLVMLLPVQVTLAPSYLILSRMGWVGTRLAVIAPAVFSPFGAFLLYQFMRKIPKETLEGARVDGAGELRIFLKIGLPQAVPGIAALGILTLIDCWSMVEQPLIFLTRQALQPLSVSLALINQNDIGIAFVCGAVFMAPMLLCYWIGEEYLLRGIASSVPEMREKGDAI